MDRAHPRGALRVEQARISGSRVGDSSEDVAVAHQTTHHHTIHGAIGNGLLPGIPCVPEVVEGSHQSDVLGVSGKHVPRTPKDVDGVVDEHRPHAVLQPGNVAGAGRNAASQSDLEVETERLVRERDDWLRASVEDYLEPALLSERTDGVIGRRTDAA
jgi:hypothetical protein